MTTSYFNPNIRHSYHYNTPEIDVLSHAATTIAYNISRVVEHPLNTKLELCMSQLKGWNVLCHSPLYEETSQYNLRTVVFINNETKALHFAVAGTNPTNYNDIIDDIRLYFHKMVNKLYPMQALINKVDTLIGSEAIATYSVSSSGHSLGAVVSDLIAAEMLSQGRNFTKSTTFDSPGSKPIVESAIRDSQLTGNQTICVDDVAQHCKVLVGQQNFINSLNTQIVDKVNLLVRDNTSDVPSVDNTECQPVGWSSFLYNTVGSALEKASDYLGISKIQKVIEQHRLNNFANSNEAIQVDQWVEHDKGYYNPTPIILAENHPPELITILKDIADATSKDILFQYEEVDSEGIGQVNAFWISCSDFTVANKMLNDERYGSENDEDWVDLTDDTITKSLANEGLIQGVDLTLYAPHTTSTDLLSEDTNPVEQVMGKNACCFDNVLDDQS